VYYAFHHLFGNDDVESAVRVVVEVESGYEVIVDRVMECAAQAMKTGDVWKIKSLKVKEGMEGFDDDAIKRVIQKLCGLGYIAPWAGGEQAKK
jgi:hypothetical protein